MSDLLLEEDWAHRKRIIEHLDELLAEGEQVIGPAANRVATAVEKLPRFLTPTDERRLRRDPELVIYENPAAIALCVFQLDLAMCIKKRESGRELAPNLLDCHDECRCLARTEAQIAQIEEDAIGLRMNAELSPLPQRRSLLARAERNDHIVAAAREADVKRGHRPRGETE